MSAIISDCGRYRYTLERYVESVHPAPTKGREVAADVTMPIPRAVLFVMLNPSTADETADDPTIRRCIGFARAWGFSRLLVGNLFAYRATYPEDLRRAADPVGPGCDRELRNLAVRADLIVCAWGAQGGSRASWVRKFLASAGKPMHHLGLTRDGQPKHPLYLRCDTQPQPWVRA